MALSFLFPFFPIFLAIACPNEDDVPAEDGGDVLCSTEVAVDDLVRRGFRLEANASECPTVGKCGKGEIVLSPYIALSFAEILRLLRRKAVKQRQITKKATPLIMPPAMAPAGTPIPS